MDVTPPARSTDDRLAQLAGSEARLLRVESLLRRLAARLTFAAEGRSETLDHSLEDIRRRVRESVDEAAITAMLTALADAIKTLDDAPAPTAAQPGAPTGPLAAARQALLDLLDQLQLDDADEEDMQSLRDGLADAADITALATQIEALAGLINQHCRRIGEQRAAAEKLLEQVTEQLEELASYLVHEGEDHREGVQSRQALDRSVLGEMQALDKEVRAASDLGTLQQGVRQRIGSIAVHLKNFREREELRERDWQARSESMNERIKELEHTAQAMEVSLRQEQQLAATDRLTGVANRLVFEQRIAQACARMARERVEASLLVLDIDRFKQINDTFGHAAGDRTLRVVAQQLTAQLRPEDLLARYGGEEFVAVLGDTGSEEAMQVAERLRQRIEQLGFHSQKRPVKVTVSCGVTTLRHGDTPASAFERADSALYKAKRGGRNRCEQL